MSPILHSFTQISLPKEFLNYSEEPWIGEVIYLSWPPFLDTFKKSWLFGFLWTVTISYNGQQCNQNSQFITKKWDFVVGVKKSYQNEKEHSVWYLSIFRLYYYLIWYFYFSRKLVLPPHGSRLKIYLAGNGHHMLF